MNNTPKIVRINPQASLFPMACDETNIIVYDQLKEISRSQANELHTSHDGAGYLHAVSRGRKRLGCPDEHLVNANGNDTSASH